MTGLDKKTKREAFKALFIVFKLQVKLVKFFLMFFAWQPLDTPQPNSICNLDNAFLTINYVITDRSRLTFNNLFNYQSQPYQIIHHQNRDQINHDQILTLPNAGYISHGSLDISLIYKLEEICIWI